MDEKFMYIPNDDTQNNSSVDYNQWLKRQETQLNKPTNKNSIKVPNVDRLKNKKILILKCPLFQSKLSECVDSTFSFKENNQLAPSSHPIQQPKTYYERRRYPKYSIASLRYNYLNDK